MTHHPQYIIGTSGYSFADWVGSFYPAGTRGGEMFENYIQHFTSVELNYTYYRMPAWRTMDSLARKSPDGFLFWVKANQETTHKQNRLVAEQFIDALTPMRDANKLAGVLLQFPQSFHRTVDNRKYLASVIDDFASVPLAVEFRHYSWDTDSTFAGLRDANVTLVIPDVPEIPALFHHAPLATNSTGYLRLHSRNADNWYAGGAKRYDYDYADEELRSFTIQWAELANSADKVFTMFNNCHRGQAAANAQAFQKIVAEIK